MVSTGQLCWLPPEVAQEAIRKGWAEQHPVARMGYIPQNVVMIYAPRDAQEIEVVAGLVDEAYRYTSSVVPEVGQGCPCPPQIMVLRRTSAPRVELYVPEGVPYGLAYVVGFCGQPTVRTQAHVVLLPPGAGYRSVGDRSVDAPEVVVGDRQESAV